MTRLFGIIGYPLAHSSSPGYFNAKFEASGINAQFKKFPLSSIDQFPDLLILNPSLSGLNVTIPHKQAIIPFLDELDMAAKNIGAVNCIAIKDGKTKGYNTDVSGFKDSLAPLLQPQHTRALVLGTGGAAHAVTYVLKQAGIPFITVSRNKSMESITYGELTEEIINNNKLIINTTPLGMYPAINDAPPIPYGYVGSNHLLYDLIYNPEETKFLALGKANGAKTKNGLEMLHLQAEAGWKIWNK